MEVTRKQSTSNFPQKEHFINVGFFGKCDVLCFLVDSVLRFAFLPYYQQANLLSVIEKIFEKLVNNRLVDQHEKCGLF